MKCAPQNLPEKYNALKPGFFPQRALKHVTKVTNHRLVFINYIDYHSQSLTLIGKYVMFSKASLQKENLLSRSQINNVRFALH